MQIDIHKSENENDLQYIWRICSSKDNGILDCSWSKIAEIINNELYNGDVIYGESTYRKKYQQGKSFYEHVFSKFDSHEDKNFESDLYEIKKEKQKLFDERKALNKTLRESARLDEDLNILKSCIETNGSTTLPPINNIYENSDNDLIICLSDLHFGIDAHTKFGEYDSEIAKRRVTDYIKKILNIRSIHGSENAYIFCIGDMVSGNIHFNTQLENRENVIQQIQGASELISLFIYEISKYFNNVYVHGVAGNHSRLGFKDQVIRGERLDNIIPWYAKAKLGHIENIKFIDDKQYDSTIGYCDIRGKRYLLVHGDYDTFDERGVSKLVMMIGLKPEAIFYGHLHHCSYDDIGDVKIIRSGSFCGTCDDFTITKRLKSNPSQMVCCVNEEGVCGIYPVELN